MKNNTKRVLSLTLALIMLLALAACGSKSSQEGPQTPGKTDENTPEFAYVTEFKELYSGEGYYYPRLVTDDGFYTAPSEKVGESIPEGAVKEYEGQFDVYETRLYFISNEGQVRRLEAYAPIGNETDSEGKKQYYGGSELSCLFYTPEDKLIAIESVWASWYEGEGDPMSPDFNDWEGYKSFNKYYLRVLDKDGAELSRTEMDVGENGYLSTYNAKMDKDGNILVSYDTSLRAYSQHGDMVCEIPCDYYIDNIISMPDGSIAVMAWGDSKELLIPVDLASGSFGEAKEVPNDAWNMFSSGGDYDLYYTSGTSLYGYNLETATKEKLLSWINCDVNGDNLSGISITEGGNVSAYSVEWDNDDETYTVTHIDIQKVPYDSVPHKETLRFATIYMDYNIRDMIIDFNRSSDTCRIEVEVYGETYGYSTDDNAAMDATTVLKTEIMAGKVPDIIDLSSLPYDQLAAKGVLADLYPMIDADPELDREDFFANIFSALEVGGGLYAVTPGFYIDSLIGASSVVGDKPGWTFEDYYAALATMPEGCQGFGVGVTKAEMLENLLAINMDSFVDWSTGNCSFESEEFLEILKFTDQFPKEFDWESYEWSEQDDAYYRVPQGLQLLMNAGIYSIDELLYSNYDSYFGGDVTYVGYPSMDGNGNVLSFSSCYGISSSSEHKEEAWQIVRTFLTEEYQEQQWNLPTNKAVYEKAMEEACTIQYQQDENGNYRLDENGEKIPIVQGWHWNDQTGEETAIYCLTEHQAATINELVNTTNKYRNYNNSIYQIVLEQAEAYFAGQKSAEEVARLIQSKANIYVNEQR